MAGDAGAPVAAYRFKERMTLSGHRRGSDDAKLTLGVGIMQLRRKELTRTRVPPARRGCSGGLDWRLGCALLPVVTTGGNGSQNHHGGNRGRLVIHRKAYPPAVGPDFA